jgi:hypothetical protein
MFDLRAEELVEEKRKKVVHTETYSAKIRWRGDLNARN